MAREKWPFCDDWQERTGFEYRQAVNFMRHLRALVPVMTDEQESEVWRYMWNANLGPTQIDRIRSAGRFSKDVERFADNPQVVASTLNMAYRAFSDRRSVAREWAAVGTRARSLI